MNEELYCCILLLKPTFSNVFRPIQSQVVIVTLPH
jgi:hypothetical protein